VPHQFEALVIEQMLDIAARSGEEIVDAENICPEVQQTLTQMRAEKSSAARDEYARFKMHPPSPFS
jgi:hypothetical protein